MNAISAIAKMQKLMRLKHYSLKTEETLKRPERRHGGLTTLKTRQTATTPLSAVILFAGGDYQKTLE